MPSEAKAQFGMIGMAVMGRNLALNILDHDYSVAGYNLEPELMQQAVEESGSRIHPTATLAELVQSLERPRRIMMMIKAGKPVDIVLDQLAPLLEPGDVVIDGGNSWYQDTRRREAGYAEKKLQFLGVGVSGGEEGARYGPSLMPGGHRDAYQQIRPHLRGDRREDRLRHLRHACGVPTARDISSRWFTTVLSTPTCRTSPRPTTCCETSAVLLRRPSGRSSRNGNEGPLESFLIEITAKIFTVRDPKGSGFLVSEVLDKAGQKGTGRWTAQVALDLAVPIPSIAAAIDARVLSSMKVERILASRVLGQTGAATPGDAGGDLVAAVHDALYAAKVVGYAQGMALIAAGAREYGWAVNLREMARIWKGGCIIRARFLDTIMKAYERDASLVNLLLDPKLGGAVQSRHGAWREVVGLAQTAGIPVPAMGSGLAYYDSYRSESLPQNLTQAQRDAFGAHTYQRRDDPEGPFVHTDWLG